jgi:diacylglycerol kinase family enzyme
MRIADARAKKVPSPGTALAASAGMRVAVVYNQGSGQRHVSRHQLTRALTRAGHVVGSDADVVVAAGGDGTVARVAASLVGSDRSLAIAPLGTANNLARGTGQRVGKDVVGSLLALLARHEVRTLDVGLVDHHGGTRSFYESAGAGLFADALS